MKESIHRIVMSKKVAARFIEAVSETGRTLTVYFPTDTVKRNFISRVARSSVGGRVSIGEGFDHATFISLDSKAVKAIEDMADSSNLDWNDL